MVTNEALRRPPKPLKRHQLDYTIHWPELRSVDYTDAPTSSFHLRAVDASAASATDGKMSAVGATAAPKLTPDRRPEIRLLTAVPKYGSAFDPQTKKATRESGSIRRLQCATQPASASGSRSGRWLQCRLEKGKRVRGRRQLQPLGEGEVESSSLHAESSLISDACAQRRFSGPERIAVRNPIRLCTRYPFPACIRRSSQRSIRPCRRSPVRRIRPAGRHHLPYRSESFGLKSRLFR